MPKIHNAANYPEAPSSFPQRIAISWRPQEKIYINHRVGVVKQWRKLREKLWKNLQRRRNRASWRVRLQETLCSILSHCQREMWPKNWWRKQCEKNIESLECENKCHSESGCKFAMGVSGSSSSSSYLLPLRSSHVWREAREAPYVRGDHV
jgi:hypothetical protein